MARSRGNFREAAAAAAQGRRHKGSDRGRHAIGLAGIRAAWEVVEWVAPTVSHDPGGLSDAKLLAGRDAQCFSWDQSQRPRLVDRHRHGRLNACWICKTQVALTLAPCILAEQSSQRYLTPTASRIWGDGSSRISEWSETNARSLKSISFVVQQVLPCVNVLTDSLRPAVPTSPC